ncbi:pyocin activator PrtN family protein [Buttiauxella massiliensis]|uniref:pyocin activator PrtN family protein n=1 Tax=Buttiauxella massiliensis TaxID=2831590 RepID=UPI00125F8F1C|nr:pyocin activator PrtN family protein [Buttiauxella massiliensis]
MNTVFLLLAEFGTPTIPLADVCEKYFGLKPATAEKKASMGEFAVPTFRASDSQKAPRMIHIQDLADHLESQRQKGIDFFKLMQVENGKKH